jgi:hypothetical protein
MISFLKLIKKLTGYGTKPVKYAYGHKSTLLDLIKHHWSVASLVIYVLDRV